jgi:large subunit ribosomal protein L13
MKSYIAKQEKIDETHKFHLIDAEGVVLGRLATKVAELLCGKHKPIFTPFLDCGDHVIILNAGKIKITGSKTDKKLMISHSRYPGGLKTQTYGQVLEKHPDKVILKAVRGMLPKSKLGRKMLTKLRVYAGSEHPHIAQQPVETKI